MRVESTSIPLSWYVDDVMRELDFDWDRRISLNEPFLPFRAQSFMWAADRNHDRYVDRFELSRAIEWRVDRNMDGRIDREEALAASRDFGLPARHFGIPASTVDFGF